MMEFFNEFKSLWNSFLPWVNYNFKAKFPWDQFIGTAKRLLFYSSQLLCMLPGPARVCSAAILLTQIRCWMPQHKAQGSSFLFLVYNTYFGVLQKKKTSCTMNNSHWFLKLSRDLCSPIKQTEPFSAAWVKRDLAQTRRVQDHCWDINREVLLTQLTEPALLVWQCHTKWEKHWTQSTGKSMPMFTASNLCKPNIQTQDYERR